MSNNSINSDTIQLSGSSAINNFTLDVSGNLENNAAGVSSNDTIKLATFVRLPEKKHGD